MKLDETLTQEVVNNIEIFAKIATNLNAENYNGTTEQECYYQAFINYIEEPKNKNLKSAYNNSLSSALSKGNSLAFNILFGLSIDLALFEKKFRTEGIKDKKLIDKYNKLTKEYNTLIDLNIIREEETNISM